MSRLTVIREPFWEALPSALDEALNALIGETSWTAELDVPGRPMSLGAGRADVLLSVLDDARDPERIVRDVAVLRGSSFMLRIERQWLEVADLGPGLLVSVEREAAWFDAEVARAASPVGASIAVAEDATTGAVARAWIAAADFQRLWSERWDAILPHPTVGLVALAAVERAPPDRFMAQVRELLRLSRTGESPGADVVRGVRGRATAATSPVAAARRDVPTYLQEGKAPSCHGSPTPVTPEPSAVAAGPASVDETEALDLGKLRASLARSPVPFAGTTSPERLSALRVAAPAAGDTLADGDETMALPTAALRAAVAGDDFADGLREVHIPDLSVDHYAALVVELEVKGSSAEVLRRHGIPTSASLKALHAEQQRRMSGDAALRARFEERRAHFLRFAKREHE